MRRVLWLGLIAALIALPVAVIGAAGDGVVYKGIDLFHTSNSLSSFMDFSTQPIPAGFFCRTSQAFTEVVHWRGVPVATGIRGELGSTDTIVERLDDGVFNKKGVATTRVQFRVLQLESVTPIKTACGSFNVRVMLDGAQPITRMEIVRQGKNGGHFLAPLALRAKFVFTPVSGNGRQLELPPHEIRFPVNPRFTWAFRPGLKGMEKKGGVLVDTNFDSIPDTFLSGTSNFAAGWNGSLNKSESCPPVDECHSHDPNCMHCIGPALVGH
ncbi:MAG: hypothetical protein JF614_24420 [Acidobacteria bacterium]|nr:hypothetical protein [Acidobacteriota bacterium]